MTAVTSTLKRRTLLKSVAGLSAASMLPAGTLAIPAGPQRRQGHAGPWVYWYWLDANITEAGLRADLDAMHAAGIEGAIIFNIAGVSDATLVSPPVESHSPRWWDMVRLAALLARDRGMALAMNITDGWGTAGGDWITPEKSAQQLVSTRSLLSRKDKTVTLPTPPFRRDYYRDVAVFAFPVPDGWDDGGARCVGTTTSWDVAGADRLRDPGQTDNIVDTEEAGWIQYSFDRPFPLASVAVRSHAIQILPFLSLGYNAAANSLIVQASDDGTSFRTVHRLKAPQLGWQANMVELNHAIPPVRARHFRFVHDPATLPIRSGRDGRMAETNRLQLASLTLSAQGVVDCHQIRSGEAWGLAEPLGDAILPRSQCVSLTEIVDISAHVAPSGTCDWRPSDKRQWMAVRIGATTNGKTTSPSGRMGGLECDKFDPEAVAMQFDRWFGEALRRVGKELSSTVLKTLHMDSWESGGQNWSAHLADAFARQRGYEPGPLLLALTGIPVESAAATEGFLFDWRRTIGELLPQSFFATVERLAHENDCLFSSEPANASFPSDGLSIFRHVDLPCGEFWHARPDSDKPSDVMEAASAAQVYGKPIVGAEAWTGGLDWSEHPFTFKRQGDANFCHGINRMILHVWAHQAFPDRKPGITMFGFGSFFSETQPWWPMAGAWIDYLSRCQQWLQQGRAVADICYFMGEDIPARAFLKEDLRPALPPGYAFASINADALWRLATVKDGRIALPGGASYAMLVLPPDLAIGHRTATRLKELVGQGAAVSGPRPHAIISREEHSLSTQTEAIIAALWEPSVDGGAQVSATADLAGALKARGVAPAVEGEVAGLMWTHRTAADKDIYFLSNQNDTLLDLNLVLRTVGQQVRMHDPVDGREYLLPSQRVRPDGVAVRLQIDPVGTAILVADRKEARPVLTGLESNGPGQALRLSVTDGKLLAETREPGRWTIRLGDGSRRDVLVDRLPRSRLLAGPWDVVFDNAEGSRLKQITTLRSWTEEEDPAIRFHAGTARYSMRFTHSNTDGVCWLLSLEQCADVADVMLNGRRAGTIWIPSRPLDVSDMLVPGANHLTITVANSWRNRLIGDHRTGYQRGWVLQNRLGRAGPPTFTGEEPLLPAGLIGAVELVPCRRESLPV